MKVAVQLYTIRDKTSRDYVNALKVVSQVGYKGIEFAGHPFGTVSAEELKKLLGKLGLIPVSAHVGFKDLIEKPNNIIGYAMKLGLKYIVSEPNVREMKSLDDSLEAARSMNNIGKKIKDAGMLFGMHNHAIEFERKFEGRIVYDILVENTDPALVFFQPDVYWIKYAGYDPVEIINRLRGRCHLIHLKDIKDSKSKVFAELGRGIIDFKAIIEAGERAGADWYIFENDRPSVDSFESIKIALEYLRENFDVE